MVAKKSDRARAKELREEIEQTEGYLAVTRQSMKKYRQMRGAAAHKRMWDMEKLEAKYVASIERLTAELHGIEPPAATDG